MLFGSSREVGDVPSSPEPMAVTSKKLRGLSTLDGTSRGHQVEVRFSWEVRFGLDGGWLFLLIC